MTLRLWAIVAVAAIAGAAAGAGRTHPARDTLIRPGVGIGKLRLGMTSEQARAALGLPVLLVRERRFRGFRAPRWYTEYRTRDALWAVAFFGERGRERLVVVRTGVRRERTAGGVGVGTPVSALPKKLRPLRPTCVKGEPFYKWHHVQRQLVACAVSTRGATTIFSGDVTCSVTPMRYQGCPREKVRLTVGSVIVESEILRRHRLSNWWP